MSTSTTSATDAKNALPARFFEREDESPDAAFYQHPRFVTHIDDVTIAALTAFYAEVLPADGRILDLMSSWISHLPPVSYGRVSGLGMNAEELAANPRLDDYVVHDLNAAPRLPYGDGEFDGAVIAVSVQYLIRPVEVFRDLNRVLTAGGGVVVALSHRCFPSKAVLAFRALSPQERMRLVGAYLHQAGFADVTALDRSPERGDPLWLVTGKTQVASPA